MMLVLLASINAECRCTRVGGCVKNTLEKGVVAATLADQPVTSGAAVGADDTSGTTHACNKGF